MTDYLPEVYQQFKRRFPAVKEAFDSLGAAEHEAGPLGEKERRLVKLGVAVGAESEGGVRSHVRKLLGVGASARTQKAARLQAQDGRARQEAPGGRPPRTPGRHPLGAERVLGSGGRGTGERIHHEPDAKAARAEPKKRSLGARERDEFLRAAWRALVAGELDAGRLVFVDEMGSNVSAPTLVPGQVVVMDDLSAHEAGG